MNGLILYAILAAIILLPALLPWDSWPVLRKAIANGPGVPAQDSHPYNTMFHVQMPMPPDQRYGRNWLPIYAQEICEWWSGWAIAFLLGLPFAIAISLTLFWPGVVLVPLVMWQHRGFVWGGRIREYIGHGAQNELGRRLGISDDQTYRYFDEGDNARRLKRGYRDLFGNKPAASVREGLGNWHPVALIILALMRWRIGQYQVRDA